MQEATSKQKRKQKYKSSHQQTELPSHSALTIRRKTNKNSAQISSYTKPIQTTRPTLGGQKPKGRKNSTSSKERIQLSLKPEKGDLKHNNLKKEKRKGREILYK